VHLNNNVTTKYFKFDAFFYYRTIKFLSALIFSKNIFSFLLLFALLYIQPSCIEKSSANSASKLILKEKAIQEGAWLGKLFIDSSTFIPFNFSVLDNTVTFINDKEKIVADLEQINNNYQIKMPVFNSLFNFSISNDSLVGFWHNYAKSKDYKMPFLATFQGTNISRFKLTCPPTSNIEGEWEVTFGNSDSTKYKAVGLFNQNGSALSGTFITETGDYRFLEGIVKKDSLLLSCFDGSHAFLFKAIHQNKSLIGKFYSGNHYEEQWEAVKNVSFKLQNPDSITSISSDEDIVFSFPNLDSIIINYPSSEFSNKVTIIQIIGSWCPNCMDETIFLSNLYDQYNKKGLEIICLAYEKPNTFKAKCENLKRLIKHADAKYQFLIAGESSKKEVERTLPFIKNVTSFPTCIVLDKQGKVKKVHSGFYGPGTNKYYKEYTNEINELIEKLLTENIN